MERAYHHQMDYELVDYISGNDIPVDISLKNDEIIKNIIIKAEDNYNYYVEDKGENEYKNRIISKSSIKEILFVVDFNKHLDIYFKKNVINRGTNNFDRDLFKKFVKYVHENNIPIVLREKDYELIGVFIRGTSKFNILIEDPNKTDGYINRYIHKTSIVDICLGFDFLKTL